MSLDLDKFYGVIPTDLSELDDVNIQSPSIGDVIQWDGTEWVNVTSNGGGINQLGWVALTDSTYTSGSPLSILSGVDTVLQFNADSIIDTYAPNGYTYLDFFDAPNNRITSPILGGAYDFRVTFKCTPSANSRQLNTKYSIGTGVGSQIVIDQRSSELRTSGTPSNISITSLVYSLSTFLTNGMEIILNANTNCDVYDIALVINRTS